jgi:hypothetical protein
LQNGAALFASTSLIAIGGALTLLRSNDEAMTVMPLLPFGTTPSRGLWDLKMMGLIVIFVYAFFKFAWSYRLFNYFAIMVGAAPSPTEKDTSEAQAFAHDAGRHFNRGQRARARLPGMIYRSRALRPIHRWRFGRDVAAAICLRCAPGVRNDAEGPIVATAERLGSGHAHQEGDSRDHQDCQRRGDHRPNLLAPAAVHVKLFVACRIRQD